MEIKIEKGVPITPSKVGRVLAYPLANMEVGDSFFIPNHDRKKITQTLCYYRRKTGRTFCARTQDDGVRVWRIS